jgi:hypothetical protein
MNTLLAIWEYQGMEKSARGKTLLELLENAVSRTTQRHSELKETSDNTLADVGAADCQWHTEVDCPNCGNDPSLAGVD